MNELRRQESKYKVGSINSCQFSLFIDESKFLKAALEFYQYFKLTDLL